MEVAEAAPAVSTRPRLQRACGCSGYGPHRATCPLRQEATPATTGYVRLPPSYEPGQPCSATTPAGVQIQFLPPPSAQPGDIVPVPFPGSPPTQPAPQQAPRAPPRAPMTAEEAIAAAEEEGLTLLRAENTTGFKNVQCNNSSASKPQAHCGAMAPQQPGLLRDGRGGGTGCRPIPPQRHHTAAGAIAAPPAPPPMTAEEAIAARRRRSGADPRAAAAPKTGFYGVASNPNNVTKPFKAVPYHGGRQHYLGTFATAEEAPRRCAVPRAGARRGGACAGAVATRKRELPPRRQLPPNGRA